MTNHLKIIEEHEGNEPTGIEAETTEPTKPGKKLPWDPKLIRVDPKAFSIRQIIDMIDDGELDLAPDFQRHSVWKLEQKSRLIESILLRIPLPAFYFEADSDGKMKVVDGVQRLSAIHNFVKGKFALSSLQYLDEELGGRRYSQIREMLWGRRLQTTQLMVNVIDPQTPTNVKFDIFKRINTGGEPLTSQEIRHCMSGATSRDFLKECAKSEAFLKATAHGIKTERMADREAVLRFCAFSLLLSLDEYSSYESMDAFLTAATNKIDHQLSDTQRLALRNAFNTAMDNASMLFGDRAFRKWPAGDDHRYPINKALFEAWAVHLSALTWDSLSPRSAAIVADTRVVLRDDGQFVDAISFGTGEVRKVRLRFLMVKEILATAGTATARRSSAELLNASIP